MQTFNCEFSARIKGRTFKRTFKKIEAADTYTASDIIKAALGNDYNAMTHPVFRFGVARKAMPAYLGNVINNAGPEEM
jgi:hypothetical protein